MNETMQMARNARSEGQRRDEKRGRKEKEEEEVVEDKEKIWKDL